MRFDTAHVVTWWSGYCSNCAEGSDFFESSEEAEEWVAIHNTDNHGEADHV